MNLSHVYLMFDYLITPLAFMELIPDKDLDHVDYFPVYYYKKKKIYIW